jgi:hypothetical protein
MFPAATTGGLTQPTTGLIAGDRGCLPTVGATFIPQATNQQLTLGFNTVGNISAPAVASDFSSMTLLLCSTSGVCCKRNLCNIYSYHNTMSRVEMSSLAMFMSICFALFRV